MTNFKESIAEFDNEVGISRPLMALSLLVPILKDLVTEVEGLKKEVAELKASKTTAAPKTRTATAEK